MFRQRDSMDLHGESCNIVALDAFDQEATTWPKSALEGEEAHGESEYRTIFDSLGLPAVVADRQTCIYRANREFRKISGFVGGEMEGSGKWIDCVHPGDRRRVERFHGRVSLQPAGTVKRCRCRFIDGQGTGRDISVTVSVLQQGARTIVTFHEEVSPRRNGKGQVGLSSPLVGPSRERGLHVLSPEGGPGEDRAGAWNRKALCLEELIHVNRMETLGRLVSGVAHEINNPNSFIMFNASLLSDMWRDAFAVLGDPGGGGKGPSLGGLPWSDAGSAVTQLLRGITDGSKRIQGIITDLRNYARGEGGRAHQPVDVNSVVQDALRLLQGQIKRYTRNLKVTLADDLPRIRGNDQHLAQVMVNLIINALLALPSKDRGVEVSTGCVYQGQLPSVLVRVKDEGVGMTPEILERSTEPFFSTRHDSGGSGLGLSICRSIIADHGGSLQFESEPGQGTTIHVKLPSMVQEGR